MTSSYFNPTPLSFNPTWNEAFSTKLDSVPYSPSTAYTPSTPSTSSAGGSMVAPAIIGAGISSGVNFLGGLLGNRQQASVSQAQLDAQADALKQGILFQRDAAKANLGLGMFNQVFGATTAPDLEFGRQAAAQRLKYREFLPKEMGLNREDARWQASFENSADVKEASRRARLGRLQESLATLRATPTGMFGRIAQAPIESLIV